MYDLYSTNTVLHNWDYCGLSPGPFVFCVIYGYCMTFDETASPDKFACGIMNSGKFPIKVQVTDVYKYQDVEQV